MVCVIGACAVDAVARRETYRRGTSNPSEIRLAAGGVGYRIFRALNGPRTLITALGGDALGSWLGEQLRQEDGAMPLVIPGFRSGCYLALMQRGELLYGAADMAVIEQGLDWPRLQPHLPPLGAADLLVLEANLAPALVRRLLAQYAGRVRIIFESVSVEKLSRHAPNLEGLYLLSGNEEEIAALVPQEAAAPKAGTIAEFLTQRRIDHLLITRGGGGVRLCARWAPGKSLDLPPRRRVQTADTTGAGDRLLAGLLSALGRGLELPDAVASGMEEVEKALEEGTL